MSATSIEETVVRLKNAGRRHFDKLPEPEQRQSPRESFAFGYAVGSMILAKRLIALTHGHHEAEGD